MPAPRCEGVALAPVARLVADALLARHRGRRVDLVGPAHLSIRGDALQVRQIIDRLVDNAARHSAQNSLIIVWWRVEKGMGVLRVLDHGAGVPVDVRDKIFSVPLGAAHDRSQADPAQGSVDLACGRRLAAAMGGDLDLESTGHDGSTFRLRLPLAEHA